MRTVGGDGLAKLRGDPMEGDDYAHGKTDGADWIGKRASGRLGREPRPRRRLLTAIFNSFQYSLPKYYYLQTPQIHLQ